MKTLRFKVYGVQFMVQSLRFKVKSLGLTPGSVPRAQRAGHPLVDTIRISKSVETLKRFRQLSTRFPLNGQIHDVCYTS